MDSEDEKAQTIEAMFWLVLSIVALIATCLGLLSVVLGWF